MLELGCENATVGKNGLNDLAGPKIPIIIQIFIKHFDSRGGDLV